MSSRLFYSVRYLGVLILTQWLVATSGLAQAEGGQAPLVDGYRLIEWIDLMPEDDLDALLNPPDFLDDIADGSVEDQIASQIQMTTGQADGSRYHQALTSTRVIPAFDGQAIRLPGFIVPLEFGENQQVTTFFLVPYFGACIHLPPPPPNQIIYAEYDKGLQLESLYEPFWISGQLSTTMIENDTATAAYAIKVERVELYTEE